MRRNVKPGQIYRHKMSSIRAVAVSKEEMEKFVRQNPHEAVDGNRYFLVRSLTEGGGFRHPYYWIAYDTEESLYELEKDTEVTEEMKPTTLKPASAYMDLIK